MAFAIQPNLLKFTGFSQEVVGALQRAAVAKVVQRRQSILNSETLSPTSQTSLQLSVKDSHPPPAQDQGVVPLRVLDHINQAYLPSTTSTAAQTSHQLLKQLSRQY